MYVIIASSDFFVIYVCLLFFVLYIYTYIYIQLFCGGEECCYGCTIRGVKNIEVSGIDSLSDSTIFSELENGNTMILAINGMHDIYYLCKDNVSILVVVMWMLFSSGTNNNNFNIYCHTGNICKIKCLSNDSCSNLRFHCFEVGTCFVDCDESSGINCPSYGVYSVWTTQEPIASPNSTTYSSSVYVPSSANMTITITTSSFTKNAIETTAKPSTTATPSTTGKKENSGDDPSLRFNLNFSTTVALVICLGVIVCCFWLVSYLVFKQKAASKMSREMHMNGLNHMANVIARREKEKENKDKNKNKNNKSKQMQPIEIIEFGNTSGAIDLRSRSTSNIHGNRIANGENGKDGKDGGGETENDSDGEGDDDDSVSELFDTSYNTIATYINGDDNNNNNNNDINTPHDDDNNINNIDNEGKIPKAARVVMNSNSNTNNINVGEALAMYGEAIDGCHGIRSDGAAIDVTTSQDGGGIEIIGLLDEHKYREWSKKDVLLWLKENLINNGFKQDQVKTFLKEFSKMGITGGTLYVLKTANNIDEKFKTLRSEFSEKNQVLGIWMVVQSCIENVGQNENNKNNTD